jgi:hypothetical protein
LGALAAAAARADLTMRMIQKSKNRLWDKIMREEK